MRSIKILTTILRSYIFFTKGVIGFLACKSLSICLLFFVSLIFTLFALCSVWVSCFATHLWPPPHLIASSHCVFSASNTSNTAPGELSACLIHMKKMRPLFLNELFSRDLKRHQESWVHAWYLDDIHTIDQRLHEWASWCFQRFISSSLIFQYRSWNSNSTKQKHTDRRSFIWEENFVKSDKQH